MLNLSKYQTQEVELGRIDGSDSQFQCRQLDDADVKAMAESLKKDGQKIPVNLLKRKDGRLQILFGFTKYLAAKLNGQPSIIAVIIPEEDFENETEMHKMGVVENARRKQLTDVDKMKICKKLSALGVNNVDIGQTIGKSEKQVRRYIKIASAPAEIQKGIGENTIPLRAIDNMDPATGKLGTRAEQPVDNPNCYIKMTKTGFEARLKYHAGHDGEEVVKKHIAALLAAYRQTQKAQEEASKGGAQKQAEAEKKANEANIARLKQDIKELESAQKLEEKQALDTTGIKQKIQSKKEELKTLKPARKPVAGQSDVSLFNKEGQGRFKNDQPASSADKQIPNNGHTPLQPSQLGSTPLLPPIPLAKGESTAADIQSQKDQQFAQLNGLSKDEILKKLNGQITSASGNAMSLLSTPQLEAMITAFTQEIAKPELGDEQKTMLKAQILKAQEQLDKRQKPG